MADATPTGETGTPADPKTDATPPVTPTPQEPVKTEDNAVEELRKQLAQQEMRANQLANQLKAEQDAKDAEKAKELEEQNQFKSLYEQEKTKREAIEAEAEEKEKQAELKKVKQEVLGEYSEEVKALAEEAGMDLTSSDETTVNSFKEKLEKINTRLGTAKVSANNPKSADAPADLSVDDLRETLRDDNAFHELVTKKFPGINSMTKQK